MIGQKTTRYLWQGCTRTGGRGGENRHQIFLWSERTRSGHLTNESQRPAFMKWRRLFNIRPDVTTEPIAAFLDLAGDGGSISTDDRTTGFLGLSE